MLPRLMLPVMTSLLRVIDNDNGVEVPRLFQKLVPHYYKPNKVRIIHNNDIICGVVYVDRLYHPWGGVVT